MVYSKQGLLMHTTYNNTLNIKSQDEQIVSTSLGLLLHRRTVDVIVARKRKRSVEKARLRQGLRPGVKVLVCQKQNFFT